MPTDDTKPRIKRAQVLAEAIMKAINPKTAKAVKKRKDNSMAIHKMLNKKRK